MVLKTHQLIFKTVLLITHLSPCFTWDYNIISSVQDLKINDPSTLSNVFPSIKSLSSDKYVVTWCDKTTSFDVYYAIYDSTGIPLLPRTKLNTDTTYNCYSNVAVDPSGGFAIVWAKANQFPSPTYVDIYAVYFDSTYSKGTPIKVNIVTATKLSSFMHPNIAFTGQYFLTCFDPDMGTSSSISTIPTYGQLLTNTKIMTTQGTNILLSNASTSSDNTNCDIATLDNGNFVVAYDFDKDNSGSYLDVKFGIGSESTMNSMNFAFKANSQNTYFTLHSIANLPTTNTFVIVWANNDGSNSYILASIFDYSGIPVKAEFRVGSCALCGRPSVGSLVTNGFIVTYVDLASYDLYFQLFSNDGTKVGQERKVNNITSKFQTNRIAGSANSAMVFYSDTTNVYLTVLVATSTCYSSCATCTTMGDSNNHLCTTCITNYYSLEDIQSNCYGSTSPPQGYYFVVNIWRKCYNLCKSCTGFPPNPSINMLCNSNLCIANYFPKEDNLTSCFNGNIPQYYLNTNMYKKCYTACQTCTGYPTDSTTNMLCSTCISGYYPKEDNLTSCFTGIQTNYKLNGTIYQKCDSTCSNNIDNTSSNTGSSTLTTNNQCQPNFYPKEDYMANCFTGIQISYYLDSIVYKRCFDTCKFCNTAGDLLNHQCSACIDGYYPKFDNPTNCFQGQINYNYLDGNIYKSCYTTCLTCLTLGTPDNHQCTSCATNYYPKIDSMTSCFTGFQHPYYLNTDYIYVKCDNCSPSCPALTYYDPDLNNCVSCKQGEIVYNNICTNNCPIGFIKDLNTCINCKDKSMKYYNKQCVDACPGNTRYNSLTNICEDICSTGHYIEGVGCIDCSAINQFYYNNQCVEKCPSDTVKVKNICQPYINLTGINLVKYLVETCDDSPCFNGGECMINLNNVECQCPDQYIGWYCQYDVSSIDILELINNYSSNSKESIFDLISLMSSIKLTDDQKNAICELYSTICKYLI
jgi:hypothetical protein